MFAWRTASIAFLLSLAACDGCNKKTTTTPALDAATTQVASADDAGADAGANHAMSNCPTAVSGADVAISDIDGGVEIAITSKDDVAAGEIRDRAKKIADADKNEGGVGSKHDHSGAGGGQTGRCTIILRNTNVATAEIPKGSKITVTPKDKKELDWLRRETRERDAESAANAQGAGALRMAHCPSAVAGAKTTVKDASDGVVVSVLGPADKVDEIRARARHTADISKKTDGTAHGHHTGDGAGGGGVGRCPIVVEGDTNVAVREVTGGVEVDVKTAKDVAALQKEAKDRAEFFTQH